MPQVSKLIDLIKSLSPKKSVDLIFSHSWGGGTESFLQEHLLNNDLVILVRGISNTSTSNVEVISNKIILGKFIFTELANLLSHLHQINIQKIYINHLVGLDNLNQSLKSLTKYIIDSKLPSVFYLHDYFSLCPTINLIDYKHEYCGIPKDENICNHCLSTNKLFLPDNLPRGIKIHEWREPFLPLLEACLEIFVFSNSSKNLLLKCYPQLEKNIYTYKLNRSILPKIVNKIDFSSKKILNIGVLGTIAAPKGLWKLQELTQFIKVLDLPLKLTIIGLTHEKINNARVTGSYLKEDLTKIVIAENLDLFVLPSICPETYCYTADEIMQMGYPIICFDVGAPPERVSQYEHGYIVKEINSYSLLQKIIEISEVYNFKHLVGLDIESLRDSLMQSINNPDKKPISLINVVRAKIYNKLKALAKKSPILKASIINLKQHLQKLKIFYRYHAWKIIKLFQRVTDKFR